MTYKKENLPNHPKNSEWLMKILKILFIILIIIIGIFLLSFVSWTNYILYLARTPAFPLAIFWGLAVIIMYFWFVATIFDLKRLIKMELMISFFGMSRKFDGRK